MGICTIGTDTNAPHRYLRGLKKLSFMVRERISRFLAFASNGNQAIGVSEPFQANVGVKQIQF